MKLYKTLLFFFALSIFASCSSPTFIPLQPDKQTGIIMEAKSWKGLFNSSTDFELRLLNNSNTDIKNCVLVFDHKYKHSLEGLHSTEKGMIKDSLFRKGEQLTIQFTSEINNLIFFNVSDESFFPETVSMDCDSTSIDWQFR